MRGKPSDYEKWKESTKAPSWEWVQQFLYEDKIIAFATCAELWGNVPNIYPEFKTILNNQILELEKKYI